MRVVWSFWTKPFKAHRRSIWISEKQHLLAWLLSVETAKKHYPKTSLFTDDEGAQMLAEGLGLEFEHVSTELNALNGHDPGWWALGKIYTYRAQTEPFVHIDNDVFLWKALPGSVAAAPLFAQNPEHFVVGASYYQPEKAEVALTEVKGWAPEEWHWYTSRRGSQAVCCGLIGANHVDFINYFAEQAIKLVEHPQNQLAWSSSGNKMEYMLLIEQYLLAACLEFHRGRPGSPFKDIDIRYLFDSSASAFNPTHAAKAGFTHLIANAKQNKALAARLELRVKRDYPALYERCLNYLIETWS